MKVKGFKKGANMNFSNASGNGEQVEFTLSNGISGVMLLNESKTLISFSEAPKSDSVKVFANGNELSVTGRGKDYNTSAINTESTVEIEADSPNTGFGNWLENLIVLLSTALTDAFTPSRITVEECASRITFRLEDFTSFYQALVEDGGNAQVLLNPEGDTFLNYFVNVQAGLVGGEQYELPLIVNMPTNQFGDVALMADEYQSFDTYVENVSEVGFGEDFDGTFTVNITAENGDTIVSETITDTDSNYDCDIQVPVDDSYPNEPVQTEPEFTIIDAKCDEFTISIVPNGNTLGMVNVFLEGQIDGNTENESGVNIGTNLALPEFSISSLML